MSKIKVLHVLNVLENGGIESFLFFFLSTFDKSIFSFEILVYNNDDTYYEMFENIGVKIHVCPIEKNKISKLHSRRKFKKALYKKEKYDIVHVHTGVPSFSFSGGIEKKYIKVRFFHCHNSYRKTSIINKIAIWLAKKRISSNYTNFIAVSKKAAEWGFTKRIVKNNNYLYLTDGIVFDNFSFDTNKRITTRQLIGVENNTILMGNIGRLTEQKNQAFLIDLLYELRKNSINCKLLIVGSGHLDKELKSKVSFLNLDDYVIFYGQTQDVQAVLSAMDVFVFPSIHEGLGIVAIEAQANGLPVIESLNVPPETIISNKIVRIGLDDINLWINSICDGIHVRECFDAKSSDDVNKNDFNIENTVALLSDLCIKSIKNS